MHFRKGSNHAVAKYIGTIPGCRRSSWNSPTVRALAAFLCRNNLLFFLGLVSEVLTDAQQYSQHAGKTEIDKDDVKLAVKSRNSFDSTQPPPKDVRNHFVVQSTYLIC